MVSSLCCESYTQGRNFKEFAKSVAVRTEEHKLDHLLKIDLQLLSLSFSVGITFRSAGQICLCNAAWSCNCCSNHPACINSCARSSMVNAPRGQDRKSV